MRKADIVSAAVIVVSGLALVFSVIPVWVPVVVDAQEYGLGARDMPTVAAVTVTVLAALFLFRRLRDSDAEEGGESAPPISRANARFLLSAALLLVAMTALFAWAGFLVAGPLTVAGFMLRMGERRPLPIAVTALAAAGAIWVFFWQLLKFPLP